MFWKPYLLSSISPYLKLIRFEKPIGTFLLLWPTLWGLIVASNGSLPLNLMAVFLLGVFLMRSSGCIVNDLADRKFDGFVKRTQSRPLATKAISVNEALVLLGILLSLSASLLLFLNFYCFKLALIAVALTILYPFCKRFFSLPQLILCLTFSFGVLMAYAATQNQLSFNAFFLYGLAACWIFMFDTQYALVDQDDDLKLGLFSSAITLGKSTKPILFSLMGLIQILWLLFYVENQLGSMFLLGLGLSSCCFLYQITLLISSKGPNYFKAFLNNNWYGLIMCISLWISVPLP